MKILLFYSRKKYAPELRLWQQAKGRHAIDIAESGDLLMEHQDNKIIFRYKDKNILEYDAVCIFNNNTKIALSFTLAAYLARQQKIVLNSSFGQGMLWSNKLQFIEKAALLKIPHPKSIYINSKKDIPKIFPAVKLPVIVKKITTIHGSGVHLFSTKQELKTFFSSHELADYIFQEYIPTRQDTRVICVGYQAIGAMTRRASAEDFRTNLRRGGFATPQDLSPDLIKLAERSAKAVQAEMAGVDILTDQSKKYVLEVNHYPGFVGFYQATGINVAEYIIRYIEKLAKKKK